MDTGGGWGGDRAPLFERRELDRVPLTRTSTTQPVGTVRTTHSNQSDRSQAADARQRYKRRTLVILNCSGNILPGSPRIIVDLTDRFAPTLAMKVHCSVMNCSV